MTEKIIKKILDEYANPSVKYYGGTTSYIEVLRLYIKKERNLYTNLNLLKTQGPIFHGTCWCPKEQEQAIM